MKHLVLGIGIFVFALSAFASPKEFYYQRYLQRQLMTKGPSHRLEAKQFSQLIDHENAETGTFDQRYYIDSRNAETKASPVFFYVCGESTCEENSLYFTVMASHARSFKAHLVALEHRYYGYSLPTEDFSTENLKYLSTANALKDMARFQEWLTKEKEWTGSWVVFGGSYAGSVAAYYRAQYPDLVVGALASSAPVKADENFDEYDKHVTEVVGQACGDLMRESVSTAEASEEDADELKRLKKLFRAEMMEDFEDFLYLIADIGAIAVQYGMRDEFCSELEKGPTPIEGYARFARRIYDRWGLSPLDMSAQGALSENPDDYVSSFGMRQWFYQSCTEYGYWQNAHLEASVRSSRINADYHERLCKRLFGIEAPVPAETTNVTFYEPLLQELVSNIFFTNGSRDPWSLLSISEVNENAINPNTETMILEDASHCDDLGYPSFLDPEPVKQARSRLRELITLWLSPDDE